MSIQRKKGKSQVWSYFNIEEFKIKCKIQNCSSQYSMTCSTFSLRYHLQINHQEQFKKLIEMQNPKIQTNILTFFQQLPKKKVEEINKCLSMFIAQDMRAFEIVNGDGFKQFVYSLEPRYKIPSTDYFRKTGIPILYDEQRKLIQKRIDLHCNSLSYTCDYWTSVQQDSYFTLTLHFIDDDFFFHSYVLSTCKVNESHTGQLTGKLIKDILREYNIIENEFVFKFATTDKGTNLVMAINTYLNTPHIPCLNHSISNFIQSIYTNPEDTIFYTIKEKVSKLATFLRGSYLIKESLKKICDEKNWEFKPIKMYSKTRFNGIYFMLNSVLLNQRQIDILSTQDGYQSLQELKLNFQENKQLEEIVNFLRPFNDITVEMSGSSYVTSSSILLYCHIISNELLVVSNNNSEWLNSMIIYCQTLYSQYFQKEYIDNKQIQNILIKCTLLDPRYKNLLFLTERVKQEIQDDVKQELQQLMNEQQDQQQSSNQNIQENISIEQKEQTNNVKVLLKNLFIKPKVYSNDLNELDQYLMEEEDVDETTNPLLWWRQRKQKYKYLSQIAKIYLSVQSTSTSSERVFSKQGFIINKNRSCLKEKQVKKLVSIAFNSKELKRIESEIEKQNKQVMIAELQ